MVGRIWFCVLWSAIAALLFEPAFCAEASDQVAEPECERRKRASMKGRGATIDFIDAFPKKWDLKTVTVNFMRIEFDHANVNDDTLTYACRHAERQGSFPAYAGFAWMILMPSETEFSLAGPSRVDTTIRSYLEEIGEDQNGTDDLRVLVSGPFWKLSRRGEVPIGDLGQE